MVTDAPGVLNFEKRLELARRKTNRALYFVSEDYKPRAWQKELGTVCDGLVSATLAREGKAICAMAPPRHGKTYTLGIGMPLHAMIAAGDEPMPILYTTANEKRASEVSYHVRTAVENLYKLTGELRWKPGRTWGSNEWETKTGHKWVSCGWGAATGGIGCRILIMDDLIGSDRKYREPNTREAIRSAVENDFLSRIMNRGSAIHMETRRGTEDTTAYLLAEYPDRWKQHKWKHVDPSRGEGAAAYLCPEEYGPEWHADNPHLHPDSPIWLALHQQEPIPAGGTHIRPEWLEAYYPETPEEARKSRGFVSIGVDLAATGKTSSDHCAFVVTIKRGVFFDVLEVVREKMSYVQAKRTLRELAATWRPHAVVVERAANGDGMIDDLSSSIRGIRGESATRDKLARLVPWLPTIASRQVRLPSVALPWVRPFRSELCNFTGISGESDDQVDALVWSLEGSNTERTIDPKAALAAFRKIRRKGGIF